MECTWFGLDEINSNEIKYVVMIAEYGSVKKFV